MFFTKENQTLYLDTWSYNAVLIMEELKKIILSNGGRIKESGKGYIVNRTIDELATKAELDAARVEEKVKSGEVEENELRTNYIKNRRAEAEELRSIPNDPRPVTNTTYITFILDNTHYYLQFESNPFFEFYYRKTPINSRGEYSRDAGGEELKKEWLWDCFLSLKKPATDEDRREAANLIYNDLVTAKNSVIIRDKSRRRVPNTYNSGYHYETVYAPERIAKIDF